MSFTINLFSIGAPHRPARRVYCVDDKNASASRSATLAAVAHLVRSGPIIFTKLDKIVRALSSCPGFVEATLRCSPLSIAETLYCTSNRQNISIGFYSLTAEAHLTEHVSSGRISSPTIVRAGDVRTINSDVSSSGAELGQKRGGRRSGRSRHDELRKVSGERTPEYKSFRNVASPRGARARRRRAGAVARAQRHRIT
ncbi:hypothetical protein EVAR_91457_1 [Eumeta japonica]|uniref:Uncharacterized protein n=1 Tax=Eumeta variegata TaxID=151549 RepID=A0A4C1X3I6_EUMVA|nr:hypothetical protein EVAR_91457_1 [Eumeta japonica]